MRKRLGVNPLFLNNGPTGKMMMNKRKLHCVFIQVRLLVLGRLGLLKNAETELKTQNVIT